MIYSTRKKIFFLLYSFISLFVKSVFQRNIILLCRHLLHQHAHNHLPLHLQLSLGPGTSVEQILRQGNHILVRTVLDAGDVVHSLGVIFLVAEHNQKLEYVRNEQLGPCDFSLLYRLKLVRDDVPYVITILLTLIGLPFFDHFVTTFVTQSLSKF